MASASEVSLCNRALRLMRAPVLLSLDEESESAKACKALMPVLRDEVLRAYPWNFAMARAQLAEVEPAPSWGFAHAYALPEDPYCLRVWKISSEIDGSNDPWRIEGRRLLTDCQAPVNIQYIARVIDSQLFDPLFATALAARLAAELAYPMTGSTAKEEAAWRLYERALSEARRIDAQEGTPEAFLADDWIKARL